MMFLPNYSHDWRSQSASLHFEEKIRFKVQSSRPLHQNPDTPKKRKFFNLLTFVDIQSLLLIFNHKFRYNYKINLSRKVSIQNLTPVEDGSIEKLLIMILESKSW